MTFLIFTHKLRKRALECAMNVYGFSIWGLLNSYVFRFYLQKRQKHSANEYLTPSL